MKLKPAPKALLVLAACIALGYGAQKLGLFDKNTPPAVEAVIQQPAVQQAVEIKPVPAPEPAPQAQPEQHTTSGLNSLIQSGQKGR